MSCKGLAELVLAKVICGVRLLYQLPEGISGYVNRRSRREQRYLEMTLATALV